MSKVTILNEEAIRKTLNMEQVIAAVERVYKQKAAETAGLFPMVFHEFEPGKADMDIKSGYMKDEGIYGLKLVSWFGENGKVGLPALFGTTLVFNIKTGEPIGLLNAEYITGMRTGAAGAIGAKAFARKDSETLLMVGSGHQAPFQIAAALIALEGIRKVMVYGPIDGAEAAKLVEKLPRILEEKFLESFSPNREDYERIQKKFAVDFQAVTNLEEAVGTSDVIITATPSRKPMIQKAWVKPGTHISCVGADMEGKQEIDEQIFSVARVFVDDVDQAIHVGETEIPVKKGTIRKEDIVAEIGAVLLGEAVGRKSAEDITVFDSTGIALQDLLTSKIALEGAREKGIGVVVDL